MSPFEIANIAGSCGDTIGALALIVVGLVSARAAHATAGYVVAAAGGVDLLASCCNGAMTSPQAQEQLGLRAAQASFCVYGLCEAIVWALVTYAAVLLARAISAPASGAAS